MKNLITPIIIGIIFCTIFNNLNEIKIERNIRDVKAIQYSNDVENTEVVKIGE